LTTSDNDTTVLDTLRHGADGYLLKVSTAEAIELALDQCLNGGRSLDAFVTPAMIEMLSRNEKTTDHETLNAAEKDILRSISKGIPHWQISESLNIGIHTIDFHIRSIFKKFNVHSQSAAVATALKYNII
jgi:DNA-binding NarL/FixJ family response regulator